MKEIERIGVCRRQWWMQADGTSEIARNALWFKDIEKAQALQNLCFGVIGRISF